MRFNTLPESAVSYPKLATMFRRWLCSLLALLAIPTFAGNLAAAPILDLLYVVEYGANKVSRWNTNGTVQDATFIPSAPTPHSISFDSEFNVYLTGFTSGYVRKYALDGTLVNSNYITSGLSNPQGISVNQANGDIFIVNNGNNFVSKYNANGSLVNATYQNVATSPDGILVQGNDMYVVRWASSAVGKYNNSGTSGSTINSNYLTAPSVGTWRPYQMASDSSGNFYVTGNDRILKFASNGTWDSGWVINYLGAYGLAIDSNDNIYVGAYSGSTIGKFAPDGTTIDANFITGVSSVTGISLQTVPVPEPSTFALVGIAGLGGLTAALRRRTSGRR